MTPRTTKHPSRQAKPSLESQAIGDHDWYYESRRGIEIIHEVYHPVYKTYTNGLLQVDHIKIPWRKLEASRRRCLSPSKTNKRGNKRKQ